MSKKTVFVALSGGVDSSYAALSLLSQGCNVIGLTMDLGLESTRSWVEYAKRAAFTLGIPLHVVNVSDSFKKHVIDYFVSEYLKGRTPNPCAVCNKRIKFGLLRDYAFSLGADLYATGHYACLSGGSLKRASDFSKDQSYFLCLVNRNSFENVLFPLCDVKKTEVLATVGGFFSGVPKESQEVCFLQGRDYRDFLRERVGENPGKFVDTSGKVIGEHKGYYFFTIGQRRGLGKSFGRPLYVVKIIPDENLVVLGDQSELFSNTMRVEKINWLLGSPPELPSEFFVKIRNQHEPAEATLFPSGLVRFRTPQRAITPGQIACFYKEDFVAAGAVIAYI